MLRTLLSNMTVGWYDSCVYTVRTQSNVAICNNNSTFADTMSQFTVLYGS